MSKLTRTLILGATLAAMHLVGMTPSPRPKPTTNRSCNRPPKAKSGSPGATTKSHQRVRRPPTRPPSGHWQGSGTGFTSRCSLRDSRSRKSRPLRMPPSSGSWPGSATPSLARHPPRCPPPCPTTRAEHPAGSSLPSVSWLLRSRSLVGWPCWPPSEPAAEPGSDPRPDQESRSRRSMGLPRPPGSPIALPATGWSSSLSRGRGVLSVRWSAGT
jgi:hypothetical protein